MAKIPLSWNSRTPEDIIAVDKEFGDISKFIERGKSSKWIINFFGYDNNESKAFLKKMKKLLDNKFGSDKNFRLVDEEVHFLARKTKYAPNELLQKLEKIPRQQKGAVIFYEPIDYGYKISEHKDMKLDIHKKIAGIFEERNLMLLLLGNIPYDIHYFENNSPLSKFIWREYSIREYEKNELNTFKSLKANMGEIIINNCEGNFQLVSSLESFWEEIKLEDRVNDLLNNFIEVPLNTNKEKLVFRKLASLSRFLENNKHETAGKIQYIEKDKKVEKDKILILKDKKNELFKDYFDKTALFKSDMVDEGLSTYYKLTPKDIFESTIETSGFIRNEGKFKFASRSRKKYSEEFDEIAACFETKNPVFILGAGNSMVSGAPDRKEMFRILLQELHPSKKDKYEKMTFRKLRESFQELIDKNKHDRDDLRFRVSRLLGKMKPCIGHFHLSQLVKAKKADVIITTNFDTLLEDSLMDYGVRSRSFTRLVGKKDIDPAEWKWVNRFPDLLKIFKICGDLYYGSWLAVDDKGANKWIEKAVQALEKVGACSNRHFFIILGHKFGEIELHRLFERKSQDSLTIVYVNPNLKDCMNFQALYKKKYGSSSPITIISGYYGEFDNFMQELCRRLRERGKLD